MTPSRESIYAALAAIVFNNAGIKAVFKTTGRWIRPFEQVPSGSAGCPALYLVEHPGEEQQRIGKGISPKRTLKSLFVMYFFVADPAVLLPATACNNGLDAIDDAININLNPGNVQTLGGLVEHVYIEGPIALAEGILQEFSIVNVPITILVP